MCWTNHTQMVDVGFNWYLDKFVAAAGRSGKPLRSQSVFTHGLANPMLWINHTQMVDVSFNWNLTKFVKVYFHSDHAIFSNPVLYNTDRLQKPNGLHWLRLQVYF